MKKLYVGNLPWRIDDDSLRSLFEQFGAVHSATVINDRETGRSRGFGFVEMDDGDADTAMSVMNGKDEGGRPLRVNEANERKPGGGGPRR